MSDHFEVEENLQKAMSKTGKYTAHTGSYPRNAWLTVFSQRMPQSHHKSLGPRIRFHQLETQRTKPLRLAMNQFKNGIIILQRNRDSAE